MHVFCPNALIFVDLAYDQYLFSQFIKLLQKDTI